MATRAIGVGLHGRAFTGDRTGLLVAAATIGGAILRFASLDAKGYWQDEVATVFLLQLPFDDMLGRVPDSESTPPLYYILAWGWTQLFGTGEIGTRSLSALIGTATVPVAYLAGAQLVSRRTGVIVAALVAVNPLLIWYSQEARAYALLTLLGGLSVYTFARALERPDRGRLAAWVLVSALALLTHYFALFLVVTEWVWLVLRGRHRRGVQVAAVAVVVVGAAALPLALEQRGKADWIADIGLARRIAEAPGLFLVGFETPYPFVVAAAAAVLAVVGLWLLVARADPDEQRGASVAAVLGLAPLAIAMVLAVAGLDYFIYKNVIASLLPLAVVLAAGYGARQAGATGPVAAACLGVLSVAIVTATATTPKYGREDWRRAADVLGAPAGPRVVVATPHGPAEEPLLFYLPDTTEIQEGEARVTEIDVVGMAHRGLGAIATPKPPRPERVTIPAPGFRLVDRVETDTFTLLRFRASRARPVSYEKLAAARIDEDPLVLVERP